jgi:DNA ligase D-like protein (predicted 3'-phosphoesterase)
MRWQPGSRPAMRRERPIFVIQQHAARTTHFDFRLEADGVLKSWAVPRGPSTNPRDKRLAMPVEDHDLDYAGFEGRIPEGDYGAGAVILWDRGTWENATRDDDGNDVAPADALEAGQLKFRLDGEKLHGGWALVRMSGDRGWLLVKERDSEASDDDVVEERPESVISGRTLAELASD